MNLIKKMMQYWYRRLCSHEVRLYLHSFNKSGKNSQTFVSLVDEFYSNVEEYRKNKFEKYGYLKFDRSYALDELFLNNFKIMEKLNTANNKLEMFLYDNQESLLVLNIRDEGQFSNTGIIFVLKYEHEKWVIVKENI